MTWTCWPTTSERELGLSSKLVITQPGWASIFMWEMLSDSLCTTSSHLPVPSLIKLSYLKSGVIFLHFWAFCSLPLPTEGRRRVSDWGSDWVTLCGCLVAGWRQPTRIHRSPKTFNTSSLYKTIYLVTYELPCCDLSLIKEDCILFNFPFISNFYSLVFEIKCSVLCFHAFPSVSSYTVLTLGPCLTWYNLKIFLSVSGI